VVVPLPVEPVTATAVLFGKLPQHGDFVSRGVDPRTREDLDTWLSRSLARRAESLGEEGFAAVHDVAPVWRFVDRDQVLGPGWTAGALSPSVDRAGRRFFILLAAAGLSSNDARARGEALALAMDDLIYEALIQGLDADALHRAAAQRIEETSPAAAPSDLAEGVWWVVDAEGLPALQQRGRPDDLMPWVGTVASSVAESLA
jgi:type VI secretion system protein ImpM